MVEALFGFCLPALILILLVAVNVTGMNSFKRRWPAISDEEFVARCGEGTNPETARKVRRIVSQQLGIPYDHIYPEQRFVEDLHCD